MELRRTSTILKLKRPRGLPLPKEGWILIMEPKATVDWTK
jgi:hypothetical protein